MRHYFYIYIAKDWKVGDAETMLMKVCFPIKSNQQISLLFTLYHFKVGSYFSEFAMEKTKSDGQHS